MSQRVLTIDLGGSKVKVLATGQVEPRKAPSGREMTPLRMVKTVQELTADWEYDVVSLGFPGLVSKFGLRAEPRSLAKGWVGFDFAAAFGRPVKVMNDAAMQALGRYEGGRMLFLGLGTALGSTLVAEHVIVPLEIGQLPFRNGKLLARMLGRKALRKYGKRVWRRVACEAALMLKGAFAADYVVLGGGNAKFLKELPTGLHRGDNRNAFRGGFRLWASEGKHLFPAENGNAKALDQQARWRLV